MVFPWLLVGFGAWLCVQLVRQNGRILSRIESLEAGVQKLLAAPSTASGLKIGDTAPAFELPDASGVRHTLAEHLGRPVVLVFFDPSCGFCLEMAQQLAALPPQGQEGGSLPLVVASRGVDANAAWMRDCEGRCRVLFQNADEVAAQYSLDGTPMGCLIDESGRIASEVVAGPEALMALIHSPAGEAGITTASNASGELGSSRPSRGKENRGLEHSRINRSGLKAGAMAPAFTVPRLDGGELSLEEYRGRPVLLVFSDPECGPCEHLAPHLEAIHRTRIDPAVVMVSRRDAESNRRKAEALGLTFPIGLQSLWQVSKLYEMFYTPIGYLIDERGVIVRDVAVGPEGILALASVPLSGSGGPVGEKESVQGRQLLPSAAAH